MSTERENVELALMIYGRRLEAARTVLTKSLDAAALREARRDVDYFSSKIANLRALTSHVKSGPVERDHHLDDYGLPQSYARHA